MPVPSTSISRHACRPLSIGPLLRSFIDGSPDAIIAVDPDGMTIAHANQRASLFLGYPQEHLKNRALAELTGGENRDAIAGAGSAQTVTLALPDGRSLPVELSVQRVIHHKRQWYLMYLRESVGDAEKYRAVFENAVDATFLLRDRTIVDCNRKGYEMFGYSRKQELIGKRPFEYPLEGRPDVQILKQKMREVMEQAARGETQFFPWEHKRSDGTAMQAEVSARQVVINGVPFIMATVRDRSRQVAMENKLKENMQLFKTLIERAPFGAHLYTLCPDGKLVFTGANPSANVILRVDNRKFMGKTIEEAFPALAGTDVPAAYRRVASGGMVYEKEQISYKENNISGAYEVHAFNAGPNQVAVFFVDITERKKAEDFLRRREEEYRRLVETANEGIWVFNENYRTVYANQKMAEMLGYAPVEMQGKPMTDFIAKEELEDHQRRIIERRQGKKGNYERKFIRKDGSSCWLAVSATPLFGRENRFQGSFAMFSDVTSRRKAEQDLRASFSRLQATTEGIIASISHLVELRDPYTAGHQRHVAQLAHAIAREMGLPEDRANGIRVAGLIHDLGKIYVPAEILSKPGTLNMTEFEMIKIHPQAGYEILRPIAFSWPIAEVTYQHQERLDGSGYPRGLKNEQILLETRIVSVADTVEAMSFRRPYRAMIGLDKALEEIKGHKGTLFDPAVVDTCLHLFRSKKFAFDS